MILGAFIKQHLSFVPLLCNVSNRSVHSQCYREDMFASTSACHALGMGWLFKRSINDITECPLNALCLDSAFGEYILGKNQQVIKSKIIP